MHFVWRFYYVLNCRHTRPDPKNKYIAIILSGSNPMGFFVNTRINDYYKCHPNLLSSQVSISRSEYPFLKWDSYIDCNNLYPFEWLELKNNCQTINDGTKEQIIKVVANSETIDQLYIDAICCPA